MLTKSIFTERFMAELQTQLHNPELNGAMLAAAMGMSRMHLHRHLHRYYQRSAGEMINLARMRRCKILLKDKSLKISDVSKMVGYKDPAYFSRIFRKTYNVSPSGYRKLRARSQK